MSTQAAGNTGGGTTSAGEIDLVGTGSTATTTSNAGSGSGTSAGGSGGTTTTTQEKSWIDSLPEELRGEPSLKLHKDLPSLAKSYLSAQQMIGKEKLVVPGKNASKEDWDQVFRKLGVPDSVDKYEMKAPEGANPELVNRFKELAVQTGILPQQAEKLLGFYQDINQKASESIQSQQNAKMKEGLEGLSKEWGQAFDKELQTARAANQTFGDEKFTAFLKETGLNKHPEMIKFMNRVGKTLSEDKIRNSGGSSSRFGGMTPQEAQSKIKELQGSDMSGPYWNSNHPGHKEVVKQVQDLYSAVYNQQ